LQEKYYLVHSYTTMQSSPNKIIQTASFTEMTLVPSGVSKVIKNKLQKLALIMEFLIGHNSDSSVPSIQEASEEVTFNQNLFAKEGFFSLY